MIIPTKSPAAAILCLGSLLASLASADIIYTTDTTLTSDATLGVTDVTNSATLTIQSGTIVATPLRVARGAFGVGQVIMNGGTLMTGLTTLDLGVNDRSDALFRLNGGTVSSRFMTLGDGNGSAMFHMTNGVLNTQGADCSDRSPGFGSPGSGSSYLIDGGTWNNSDTIFLAYRGAGRLLLNNGTINTPYLIMGYNNYAAQIVQTGGSLHVTDFWFGNSNSTPVNVTLSGGVFTTTVARVGFNGAGGVINLKPGGVFATAMALLYSLNAGIFFDGGVLRATRDESSWIAGFVPGSLVLQAGGGIVDTQAFNVGIAGPFTGLGVLTKTGTGTLTLSGANAHTGGTVVSGGTLALSGSAQLGTGNVTIQPAGTLAAGSGSLVVPAISGSGAVTVGAGASLSAGGNDESTVFSGSVSGDGEFGKTGTGTLTFSGTASQAGPTNVQGGTLAVAAGGVINSPATGINVASTGTGALVLDGGAIAAGSVIIGHDGGTATVTLNSGTLTTSEIARWSVPSTIAFNGGTLRAAGHTSVLLNGFTSGSAVIQAGGLTIDTNGFTASTTAELTGSGPLTKTGSGTFSLEGAFAHTGATTVNAGTLRLTSARLADAASVSIATGATLQLDFTGTDTIGSLTLGGVTHSSGTWGAPGSGAQHETPLLSGPGRLTVVNELSAWLAANGHPGATAGGDEDHDGLTNLDEYFSGSLPGQPNASTTTANHAPGIIEITFDRRKGLQTVGAVVEWSADLTAWSTDGVSAPQVIADQGTTERLRVTVPNPTTATRRFVRVRSVQE